MTIRGQTIKERIERLSVPEPNCGCWLWLGAAHANPSGLQYGRISIGSRKDRTCRTTSAHRASYQAYIGPIPAGLEVCHKCDVTLCVNPEHLFVGTHQENIDDRERKGRNTPVHLRSNAKLSHDAARDIRASKLGCKRLARIYGVNPSVIRAVRTGRSWVPAPPVMTDETQEPK